MVTLNAATNPITLADPLVLPGVTITTPPLPAVGCNSGAVSYYQPTTRTWQSTYTNANHQTLPLSNLIYATHSSIAVRTLQTSDSTLAAQVNNTLVRVQLTCDLIVTSCVEFVLGHVAGSTGRANAQCPF